MSAPAMRAGLPPEVPRRAGLACVLAAVAMTLLPTARFEHLGGLPVKGPLSCFEDEWGQLRREVRLWPGQAEVRAGNLVWRRLRLPANARGRIDADGVAQALLDLERRTSVGGKVEVTVADDVTVDEVIQVLDACRGRGLTGLILTIGDPESPEQAGSPLDVSSPCVTQHARRHSCFVVPNAVRSTGCP